MITLDVNPKKIWGFHQTGEVSGGLVQEIEANGWTNIPRVPVFEIPIELKAEGYQFILMDGNWRRNTAEYLKKYLPSALYRIGEKVDTQKDGLAYFRHSTDPRIYEKLLHAFNIRKKLLLALSFPGS